MADHMDILYHYCSNEVFVSIIKSRTLWLSALALSNDSLEGRWAREEFEKAIAKTKPKLDRNDVQLLSQCLDQWQTKNEVLGLCFSEDGDILSQWRAYADNARGVAIGFSQARLEFLTVPRGGTRVVDPHYTLDQVVYDAAQQQEMIVKRIKTVLENNRLTAIDGFRLNPNLLYKIFEQLGFHLMTLTHLFKNPAFGEEREWRLCQH